VPNCCGATPKFPVPHPSVMPFQHSPFYGAGTLITVFTMVTDALRPTALPSSVVIAALPAVENVTPAGAMIVPTMVPPPAPLMVAALPTCQNTFLACAPLTRMTLRGAAGAPTISVVAIWKTQTAFALPWASRVRSDPVIVNEPPAAVYVPGVTVWPPNWPAPGSGPPGRAARSLYADSASLAACVAIANVTAVPSEGHVPVGGGTFVNMVPLTNPSLLPVMV
jgi:hypothetical protein